MNSENEEIIRVVKEALNNPAVDGIKVSFVNSPLRIAMLARKSLYDLKECKERESWADRDNKDDLISLLIERGLG